ncbi:MAG TPA: glycosyltransferase family 39 protein, partial [Acidimicrobiales bacterium]|nr:glycosyltransferase family 39 protein [Acidimicrobiales bacterium]
MPDEVPALTGRTRLAVGVGVALVIAAGLLLRFWTRSGLWLDEALTINVARLPLHELPNALKHDGAPPLYYVLLHFWMGLFGQSNDAVRALSGLFAVLTLPVGWLCGKRFGGRAVAWTMVVLLASAPFDVYYATESRMYAMVILLTGLGFLALERAVRAPRPGNLVAVALVTAALLYSQYWSVYLVAMVAIWLIASIWRTRRHGNPKDAPWAALIAVGAGVLLFVPWVPIFLYQAKHTGT